MKEFIRFENSMFPLRSIESIWKKEDIDENGNAHYSVYIDVFHKIKREYCIVEEYISTCSFNFDTIEERDEFFDNLANQLDAFWIKKEDPQ